MSRIVQWQLFVDWDFDTSYTDESARLISAAGSNRLAAPDSSISSPRGTVDACILVLTNHDGRYSPLNESSPIYSDISLGGAYHAPMYLNVSVDGGSNFYRIFTGVLKVPKDQPPSPGNAQMVTFECRSRDEILLNLRLSTTLATFQSLHDNDATEADIITQFLDDAGLDPSDYTIDPGLFVIPWAWLDDESPVEDIWMLAGACGGRFYCDQEGEFRYENMTHWLLSPHDTSVETITVSGYREMEGPIYDDRELYSEVTVIASPRETLETTLLWNADRTVVIPSNSTKTIIAKLRQPAYEIETVTYTAVTGGGLDMSASVSIAMTKFAQRVVLEITNSHTEYAVELVALSLEGIPVSGGPSLEETKTSSHAFWTSVPTYRPGRTRLVRGNPYVQTETLAATLAEFLRDRFQVPRITWRLKNVPGLGLRRLGDRITVANPPSMTNAREAFITSITWRLSQQGFAQDIELIDAGSANDGTGLFPYEEYFIIGTNELGDATYDIARIFY